MALPPRCQCQIGTETRPPYRIVICPRSVVPGSRWCEAHLYMDIVADKLAARRAAKEESP